MSDTSDEQAAVDTSESRSRRIWQRLELDRATVYAMSLRIWQLGGGAVTALLITQYFSPVTQGYHFTFASLMALQTFFELGFNVVVINVASHEWSRLQRDAHGQITGDPDARSRLISLGRLLFAWYGTAAVLFGLVVGIAGILFLSQEPTSLSWQSPWLTLCVLTAGLLWTLPFNALLEGCNQVAAVHRMRMLQAVTANVCVWVVISAGGGLWAAVSSAAVRLVWELVFLLGQYGEFFRGFRRRPAGPAIAWRKELWPLQWRLGLQAVAGYFAFSIFAPVMFQYHGPEMAGRMGMTWVVINALQAAAMAWVQTRAPQFGILVSRGEYQQLNQLFRRLTMISTAWIAVAGAAAVLGIALLNWLEFRIAGRLLGPGPTLIFVIASVLFHIPHCQDLYIRAHKIDPMVYVNLAGSSAIGLGVWLGGRWYGPLGAATCYLLAIIIILLPGYHWAMRRCRSTHSRE